MPAEAVAQSVCAGVMGACPDSHPVGPRRATYKPKAAVVALVRHGKRSARVDARGRGDGLKVPRLGRRGHGVRIKGRLED
jgi:hypothetical protein